MSTSTGTGNSHLQRERILVVLALLVVAVVFALDSRSVASVPLIDTYRWWGDESWLMSEFREQMHSGVFRHPYALGATIHQSNGLLFGSMWLTATVYGLPALFAHDLVLCGRVVTTVLSILLVAVLAWQAWRRCGAMAVIASVAFLITSRIFLLTSHSARYDLITGFAVLVEVLLLARYVRQAPNFSRGMIAGALLGSSLLVTVHTALLMAPVGAYLILRYARSSWRALAGLIAGAVSVVILCLLAQLAFGSPSLFGSEGSGGFSSNLQHIPAMHPLSRNVWMNSLAQKWQTSIEMMPWLFPVIAVLFVWEVKKRYRRSTADAGTLCLFCWLVILGYFLFEGPQFFYMIFMLPIVALLLAQAIGDLGMRIRWLPGVVLAGVVLLAIQSIGDQTAARQVGDRLRKGNLRANAELQSLLDSVAEHERTRPRIVLASPSVNAGVQWSSVEPMTSQFQVFPLGRRTADATMQAEHVRFVEIVASGYAPYYLEEVRALREICTRNGRLVWSTTGSILDAGRSYFQPWVPSPPDTLLLYELPPTP